jgi:Tol biopolymer transport system component
MTTNEELEGRLRSVLRESLDRELGPDPTWADSPVARRVAGPGRARRRTRSLRLLAVAAVMALGGGAALAGAILNRPPDGPPRATNGWIAYSVFTEDPAGGDPDMDIWLTAFDRPARRVIGSDTDGVDQACPAFAPDGRRLAYGSVEGLWSTAGESVARWPLYRSSTLVIADVGGDGRVVERRTIDIGDGLPPPCPVWSPAGDQLAFGVPRTSPINPVRSGEGSEVWVLRPADGHIAVIRDMPATDLEWSPDGSVLAIVGGVEVMGVELRDERIHLYDIATGTLRTLEDTRGVSGATWSPDGTRIAYARGHLRLVDVKSGQDDALTDPSDAIHGIGPVWSPVGENIAYQRRGPGEKHSVVLVRPDDRVERTGLARQVVLPSRRTTAGGASVDLYPWRATWSPDGRFLLYVAWTYPDATTERTVVAAVPTDPGAPIVVLADADGIVGYDSPDNMRVPIQVWGRR